MATKILPRWSTATVGSKQLDGQGRAMATTGDEKPGAGRAGAGRAGAGATGYPHQARAAATATVRTAAVRWGRREAERICTTRIFGTPSGISWSAGPGAAPRLPGGGAGSRGLTPWRWEGPTTQRRSIGSTV